MKLTEAQKVGIFKNLASKTLIEVGMMYGFDKHYKEMNSIKNAVYKVYCEVRATPSSFGLSKETVDLVLEAVSNRTMAKNKPTIREKNEMGDIKDMILKGRNISMKLINDKLVHLSNSKKALRETSLTQLGTLFGIIFDKGQIISGQATEHVALMGRIDKDMKPEDAINTVLKMRELNQETTDAK